MSSEIKEYGTWKHSLQIGEETLRADRIDQKRATRAGFDAIYAVDGLPKIFEDNLVRGAQVCEVPHTWCVKRCDSEDEVTTEILELGRQILRDDQEKMWFCKGLHVLWIGGECHSKRLCAFACKVRANNVTTLQCANSI